MPVLVRLAVGDDGGVDAVLLQIQRQMQAGDAGPEDSDFPFHVRLPWMVVLVLIGRKARAMLDRRLRNGQDMIYSNRE